MPDQPYIGDIYIFAGAFAPRGWAFCNGQVLPIAQYQALFSLLGTMYGGNGQTTFALPDLRGRAPMHFGQGPGLSNRVEGERSGVEAVMLTQAEVPQHPHLVSGADVTGTSTSPAGRVWATSARSDAQYTAQGNTSMSPAAMGTAGNSAPHNNMQPFLTLNFIIALEGVYPSRS
jgi:microcystin-dependent protein